MKTGKSSSSQKAEESSSSSSEDEGESLKRGRGSPQSAKLTHVSKEDQ